MCLKYTISTLKIHFNDANYHRLVKILKLSTIRRILLGCNVGLKMKGEEVDKYIGICGAKSHEGYGATINRPK